MNFRKYIPYIVGLLIFIAVTFVAFPQLFTGSVMEQTDLVQYKSMSHETKEFRKKYNSEPLWTSAMFCGMPTTQISTIYPGNFLSTIDDIMHLWLPSPARYIFLSLVGFFILLLSLKLDPRLAIVGSLAFGLSTLFFVNAAAGHNSKANAIDYLPFIFAGIIYLFDNRRALGFAMITLFVGLEFNANHIQITYYGFLFFFILFVTYLVYAYKEKTLKNYSIAAALFLCGTIIGILPNAGNLMMTYEYSKHSNRSQTQLTMLPDGSSNKSNSTGGVSKEYALEWSNNFSEFATMLIPNYKGGSSKSLGKTDHVDIKKVDAGYQNIVKDLPAYFGSQPFTNGPVYVGAIVALFALMGAYMIKHKLKLPLVITTVFALLLSLGSNYQWFTELFFNFIPGYNKFRSITMIMVLAQLCIPVLAVLSIDHLLKIKKPSKVVEKSDYQETSKVIKYSGMAILGFCLFVLIAPQLISSFSKKDEVQRYAQEFIKKGSSETEAIQYTDALMKNMVVVRKGLVKTDAFRSSLLVIAAFVLLLLYDRKKIKPHYFIAGIGFLITADLLLIGNRIVNADSYVSEAKWKEAPALSEFDKQILQDTSYYRVANTLVDNPFIDATTSYYHRSIGGYHAAKLGMYEDLSNFCLKPELGAYLAGIDSIKSNDSLRNVFLQQCSALNMINTKYIITRDTGGNSLIVNPHACGNCWFIKNFNEVVSADSEIVALRHFDPTTTAIIRSSNKAGLNSTNYDGEGKIHLVHHLPNHMIYESETNKNQFAVFSEIYYPDGWTASIDGKSANIYNVNYVLRGMEIPSGKHRIEFNYLPQAYTTGNSMAMGGSLFLLCVVVGGFVQAWRSVGKTTRANA